MDRVPCLLKITFKKEVRKLADGIISMCAWYGFRRQIFFAPFEK